MAICLAGLVRAGEAQVVAQGGAGIVAAIGAFALQDRDDVVDEGGEIVGEQRWKDVETLAGAALQPVYHVVGELFGGADEGLVHA